jgi:hypothetical protein
VLVHLAGNEALAGAGFSQKQKRQLAASRKLQLLGDLLRLRRDAERQLPLFHGCLLALRRKSRNRWETPLRGIRACCAAFAHQLTALLAVSYTV